MEHGEVDVDEVTRKVTGGGNACAKTGKRGGKKEGNAPFGLGMRVVCMEVSWVWGAGKERSVVMPRGELANITTSGQAFVTCEEVCLLEE